MYIQFIEPPTLRHIEQEEQWLQTTGNRLPEESKKCTEKEKVKLKSRFIQVQ